MNNSDVRLFETLVRVKFLRKGDRLFQYFIFDNPKIAEKVFDRKYNIHNVFEAKIREMSLCITQPQNFNFIERIDADDKTTIIGEILNEVDDKNFISYYFTLAGFISRSAGCATCVYNENKEKEFINCGMKKKTIPKTMKNCALFKEQEGLFKT